MTTTMHVAAESSPDEADYCLFSEDLQTELLWLSVFCSMQIIVLVLARRIFVQYKLELARTRREAQEEQVWNKNVEYTKRVIKESSLLFNELGCECGSNSEEIDEECGKTFSKREADFCSICLDEYEATDPIMVMKDCGHVFHIECIENWMLGKRMNSCPNCRMPIVDKQIETGDEVEENDEAAFPGTSCTDENSRRYIYASIVVSGLEMIILAMIRVKVSGCIEN